MSLFLKLFNTTAEYNAYTADTSNFILPNVSCTLDDLGTTHYNPYVDPYNGHEYVDLGLPSGTKWATMNVGALTPEEEGYFFSWGNVEGHNLNGQGTYNFGTSNTTEPYKSSSGAAITYPGSIAVGDAYDMARANMGGNWRLPTNAEFQELYDNCTWAWTSVNNVNGIRFTSSNGNSIFLPAAGYYYGTTHDNDGGNYWSSVLSSAGSAYYLYFNSGGVYPQDYSDRYFGFSVRGVVG